MFHFLTTMRCCDQGAHIRERLTANRSDLTLLALPGRGSVEVVTGSAEDVSTSEVVSAEAVDCGTIDSSPPPPEGSVCGTTGRATV